MYCLPDTGAIMTDKSQHAHKPSRGDWQVSRQLQYSIIGIRNQAFAEGARGASYQKLLGH